MVQLTIELTGSHLNIGAGRIVWQDIVKIDQCRFHVEDKL